MVILASMLEWTDHQGKTLTGRIPESVRLFVDLVGIDATVNLLLEFGGSVVQFPRTNPTPGNRIVAAIGRDATLILGREFYGSGQRVPTANKFVARYLKGRGASVQEIARRLRCSDKTVRTYVRSGDQ